MSKYFRVFEESNKLRKMCISQFGILYYSFKNIQSTSIYLHGNLMGQMHLLILKSCLAFTGICLRKRKSFYSVQ